MDIFIPSLPFLKHEFSVPESLLQLSISLFLWGFACFQLGAGVLSDRFGRLKVVMGGLVVFIIASLGCALSQTFYQFLSFRLLQGMGACVGPVTALAVSRDLLEGKKRAKTLSFIASAMAFAPVLAPLIGSFLQWFFNWHANFFFLAAYGVLLFGMVLQLKETLQEKSSIHWRQILKGYTSVAVNRNWQIHSLISGFCFAGTFSWIAASSIYLIDRLQLDQFEFATLFAIAASCFMLGAFLNSRLIDRFSSSILMCIGASISFLGSSMMLLFSWILPLGVARLWGPAVLLSLAIGFVLPNANSNALEAFKMHAGKASALMNFSRLAIAGVVIWISSHFYDNLARNLSLTIFVCASFQIFLSYALYFRVRAG